ncbi:hypothetical protein [Pseudomonas sp. N040]|uniref:hypothetical protein n=1 Tax=Pseudomonas sp. N040 TaxID=2785325 RepID=UPI0018A3063E|nr:hypothetical protein [Pseudomonas sp. N040]MBF7728750.1 hypothetical protein [Pseudomonas sp. N040]MBW7012390.1 hypothetical protein [Pseudomonas sp. N040]
MTEEFPPEVRERFDRFDAHLPAIDDPILVVLKGHLLAEEILENLIKAKCRKPETLDNVEIGFFLKAKLARALVGDTHSNGLIFPTSVWDMLEALNSLRNELAHALEPKKLDAKIQRFLAHSPPSTKKLTDKKKINEALYFAVVGTLSYLACFETIALTGKIPPRIP